MPLHARDRVTPAIARRPDSGLIALAARQQYTADRRAIKPVTTALIAECGRSLLVVPAPLRGV